MSLRSTLALLKRLSGVPSPLRSVKPPSVVLVPPIGRAGGTRTPDHRIRNQVLYPAELLPHGSRTRVTSRNETRRVPKTQDRKQGDFTDVVCF